MMSNQIIKYYNAHSHLPGENTVLNLDVKNIDNFSNFSSLQWVSLGFHPWSHRSVSRQEFLSYFDQLTRRDDLKIVAIGEVGLDRLKGELFEDQLNMFEVAVEFAQEKKLPIIVHSVKSANDILKVLKDKKFQGKCLFHDFNGSIELQERIVSLGHYVGIGHSLFRENSKVFKNIRNLSLSSILFETDEMNLPIELIYKEFCKVTCSEKNEVIEQVRTNFKEIFEVY